jgi:hypothetical protein
MNICIALLENVNKSRTSASNVSLSTCSYDRDVDRTLYIRVVIQNRLFLVIRHVHVGAVSYHSALERIPMTGTLARHCICEL